MDYEHLFCLQHTLFPLSFPVIPFPPHCFTWPCLSPPPLPSYPWPSSPLAAPQRGALLRHGGRPGVCVRGAGAVQGHTGGLDGHATGVCGGGEAGWQGFPRVRGGRGQGYEVPGDKAASGEC